MEKAAAMNGQQIVSLILIGLLVGILILRLKMVRENDNRIELTSSFVIIAVTYSLIATGINPTILDVIALYLIWLLANFFALVYIGISNYKVPPKTKLQLVRVENDEFLLRDQALRKGSPVASVRSVDISNTGDFTIHDTPVNLIQPSEYQIQIPKLTNKTILRLILQPDLMELFLLFVALGINWVIMVPITGLKLFHPFMLMYWGIISFILYTIRWSYTGPFQFAARMKLIEKEMMKGKHVVDFKIIGMIFSFVLVLVGIFLVIRM